MRTLYVKRTNKAEIDKMWHPTTFPGSVLRYYYIQCTAKGVVNWKRNAVYEAEELIERNNVKIVG